MTERNLWPKQPVQQANIRTVYDDAAAVAKIFGKHFVEVVIHLGFQHHAMA